MEPDSLPLNEKINKIKQILLPESLEQFSKVTSILSEEFQFTVDNLFQLKEVVKYIKSKDELLNILTQLSLPQENIITLNESKTEGKILISSKLILYSFVNIPQKFSHEDVIKFLNLTKGDYIRLYKQSLFWILVSDNDEFNSKFDKVYKTLEVEKSTPLKCNITSSLMLKKSIIKMIQHYNYIKETGNLGAQGNQQKDSYRKYSKNSNEQGEEMSWRKKSDASNESSNSNSNHGYKRRRQRFKSDPNEHPQYKNYYKNKEIEQIQIPLDNVKYPIFIKHKYSNKEMIDYYMSIKDKIVYSKENFKVEIDEIMSKDKCKVIEIVERENLHKAVPKNNPLLNFKGK